MTEEDVEYNPYSVENSLASLLITNMRIYDVLTGIYAELAPKKAKELAQLHHEGTIMGGAPNFMGKFVTDELNTEETTSDE